MDLATRLAIGVMAMLAKNRMDGGQPDDGLTIASVAERMRSILAEPDYEGEFTTPANTEGESDGS